MVLGILGPLVLGAVYARPLGDILPQDVQSAVLAIGYLGLILLIVQGGLEARMDIMSSPKNLLVSILVGGTGILLPIGISMALLPWGFGFGFLESFAVGAALGSTSLGTTFAVLSSFSGSQNGSDGGYTNDATHSIASTRIGTILIGSALLDDIVGLVITGVIASLGPSSGSEQGGSISIAPWTIARPIVASFLLIVVSCLLSRYALRPITRLAALRYQRSREARLDVEEGSSAPGSKFGKSMRHLLADAGSQQLLAATLLIITVLAYSVISEEIKSSLLIGAFCAGAMMKYVYGTFLDTASPPPNSTSSTILRLWSPEHLLSTQTALGVVQETILMPFFFSSIGSAIPVKSMFEGKTVWRGVIFAGLMAFAKVCAGGWIYVADWLEQKMEDRAGRADRRKQKQLADTRQAVTQDGSIEMQGEASNEEGSIIRAAEAAAPKQPVWPAALFLGTALMSRGEIGFLIINLASQEGLVNEQAFNVATWAIVLNTLAGPMSIGILMRTQHGQDIIRRSPNGRKYRWR
uniref:Cation/H+ exchanger transmembrane domain-containing protein n=1 Tax=Kalmanozyma brasiliensis (strain GHG001) TaxID=1365824 RepID=V5EUC9_KALBG